MDNNHCGLALSGGGFRASLFHLGVLARLAELNQLRQIESISTVSGGSIIGAAYYLHLKKLLESKSDQTITQDDYIHLVERLIADFCEAIKLNLRVKTFANAYHNMKMAMPSYSRSDRIGELYDEYLYRPILDPLRTGPIYMHDLMIHPAGDSNSQNFNPTKGHNDNRVNKVPIININATVLNTGHNWRFTAVEMGEVIHSHPIARDIDKNTRLTSGRYANICNRGEGFKLGKAVAASAGVPCLFPPLAVSNMFDWTVQLVDGGVYDNQGIESLLHGDVTCGNILISDASGQMRDDPKPATGVIDILSRSTSILMGRVREEVIRDAEAHSDITLMHLTQGLPITFKDYRKTDCLDAPSPRTPVEDPVPDMDPDMRGRLSRIRTDLDSFTDVESMCIMAHGYSLSKALIKPGETEEKIHAWRFTDAIDWLSTKPQHKPADLEKSLDIAENTFGKAFKFGFNLELGKSVGLFSLGMAAYLFVLYLIINAIHPHVYRDMMNYLTTTTALDILIAIAILLAIKAADWLGQVFEKIRMVRNIYTLVVVIIIRFILPAIGAIPVWLYLHTLNVYFVAQGSMSSRHYDQP